MKLTRLFNEFFDSEKAGGIILIIATAFSLIFANSSFSDGYLKLWNLEFADHTTTHWINDGLMSFFFLLIGLELEREIFRGELSSLKNASLPIFGAIGGMVIPAGIFLLFNFGSDTRAGTGIVMATDIAFAIGILSLLGDRVPPAMKIFLTALAVIDDLGAIIIIAIFYTASLSPINLFISLAVFGLLLLLNRLGVKNLMPYLAGGVLMWIFMYRSGVHATITGVLLAFAVPFGDGGEKSPSYILQHLLHKPVAYVILPLFALANTCIPLGTGIQGWFGQTLSLGIIFGLVLGKPLGIFLFSIAGITSGLSQLPSGINRKSILGLGLLGGIGFTMSLFISILAFKDPGLITTSKIAIFTGSLISGISGFVWLRIILGKSSKGLT